MLQVRDTAVGSVQRRLLILIDGRRDLTILQALMPDQNVAQELGSLASAGLIDWAMHARLAAAQHSAAEHLLPENWPMIRAWMSAHASACMGMLATPLIASFDKVSNTTSMRRAVSEWHMALRGSRAGHEAANVALARVNEMLAAI
jgi:hypothetical protein